MKRVYLALLSAACLVGCVPATIEPPSPSEHTVIAPTTTRIVQVTPTPVPITSTLAPTSAADVRLVIEEYKTIDSVQLKAHIFLPPGFTETDRRPAFVFFHGGGWYEGQPENGYQLCRHFAELGMVTIAFEYRLADQGEITPVECIMDAKSAIRWTRQHASEWGITPDQIVATGGSAGGHLAVSTAMLEGFEEPGEDMNISSCPNALIVWSAPVNALEDSWFTQLLGDRADHRDCSPIHHVWPGLPPMALLHGTEDETVPYWTIEDFVARMREAGNRCELYPYEDAGHLFHQANRANFLSVIDEFLISLGYIESIPGTHP